LARLISLIVFNEEFILVEAVEALSLTCSRRRHDDDQTCGGVMDAHPPQLRNWFEKTLSRRHHSSHITWRLLCVDTSLQQDRSTERSYTPQDLRVRTLQEIRLRSSVLSVAFSWFLPPSLNLVWIKMTGSRGEYPEHVRIRVLPLENIFDQA
jgi:hypothetical protein